MAIIVNDRDALLQTVSPRVQTVGLPSNVSIDPSSIPTLAAAYDATKEVSLNPTSQVFVVAKTGIIQPAQIEITALLRTITGTPTFSVIDGACSFTTAGNKITVVPGGLTTPTATIKVSVLFNSVTYTDTLTIGKIAEGSDAVVGLLSNEACTVAASNDGIVSGAALGAAGGTFYVFDGIVNMTGSAAVVYSVPVQTGCTVSINTAGTYTVSAISSDTGSATLRAVYTRAGQSGTVTVDKVYSVAKAIAGVVGSNAKMLYLTSTSQVFQVPKSGSVNPTNITLTATVQNVDPASTYTWTTTPFMTLTGSSNSMTLDYSNMTADTVKIDVSRDGLTDTITLVKVREGSDAIVGYLTNESMVVPADKDGVVSASSYTNAGGTFEVYQGITRLTGVGITYSTPSSTGVSVSMNGTTGVYTINSMSADVGTATLRAVLTVAGTTVTLDKVYAIAKSRAGQTGTGTNGARGTVNVSMAITGTSWTDAQAATAISNAGYGVPQTRDIVTLYNSGSSYSESKFYNGSAWITLDAYVNGNMLVDGTLGASKIIAGSITTDKLNVASGGKNILNNSGPAKGTANWYTGNNNTGLFLAGPIYDTNWNPSGCSNVYVQIQGTPTAGQVFEIWNKNGLGRRYPVKGNQRYEFSAYLSMHRARGYIYIFVYDAAGTYITEIGSDGSSFINDNQQQSNVGIGAFNRVGMFYTMPSNAATVTWGIRATCNGPADPYLFCSMAYMGEAGVNQTTFSPWSEGGMTTINPSMIDTPNLSAISANIGAITAGSIHGTFLHGGAYGDAYSWPVNGAGGGFHLSSNGLLIGNANQPGLGYIQINQDGNFYAPQFSIINGTASFAGNLSAAGGSFAGNINAVTGTFQNAVVGTLSVQGEAVSTPAGISWPYQSLYPSGPTVYMGEITIDYKVGTPVEFIINLFVSNPNVAGDIGIYLHYSNAAQGISSGLHHSVGVSVQGGYSTTQTTAGRFNAVGGNTTYYIYLKNFGTNYYNVSGYATFIGLKR